MKKLFIVAFLIFGALTFNAFGQKTTIAEMISANQKTSSMLTSILGMDDAGKKNAEMTNLSAINFPTTAEVKYLDETRKLSKIRKKAIDKWLKDFGNAPADRKFYTQETLVSENDVNYWIIAKESVIEQLKTKQKNDSVKMKVKILGFYRKGSTTDYFLLTDALE